MTWQDYIVWGIVAVAVCIAAVWLWRQVCGRRRGGCASCCATQCPMKKSSKSIRIRFMRYLCRLKIGGC